MRAALEITRRSLVSYRRPLLVWMLALGAMGLLLTLFWPSVRDASGLEDLIEGLPEALRAMIGTTDLLSPAGFLASRLNSIFPLLVTVYAAFRVSSEIAGEEQRGGFEILLGTPTPRTSALLGGFLAVVVSVAALMVALTLGLAAGAAAVAMDIPYVNVVAATSSLALLGVTFGALTLAVAGATGRRGTSLGTGAGLAVGAFFLYSFAPLVPELEWLRPFTLFDRALEAEPLRTGFPTTDALVLVAVTLIAVTIAVVTFRRRDLHGT